VTHSLERRDGLTLEHSVFLWLTYVRSALEHTRGGEERFIFYEEVMENAFGALEEVTMWLGLSGRASGPEVQQAIGRIIDPGLRHHRTPITAHSESETLCPGSKALSLAQQVYLILSHRRSVPWGDIAPMLDEAIGTVAPEVERQRQAASARWHTEIETAEEEIARLVSPGAAFILVDDNQWATDSTVAGRRRMPFLERQGSYWGPPPDDATAIQELARLQQLGARYMVFGWPAFWWLDHYAGLRQHLHSSSRCLLKNKRVVVFDLGA
jgi:hypothetical protein